MVSSTNKMVDSKVTFKILNIMCEEFLPRINNYELKVHSTMKIKISSAMHDLVRFAISG
jgi:hypothetical protein